MAHLYFCVVQRKLHLSYSTPDCDHLLKSLVIVAELHVRRYNPFVAVRNIGESYMRETYPQKLYDNLVKTGLLRKIVTAITT